MVNEPGEQRVGLLSGLAAYGLWGLMPLYFKALMPLFDNVPKLSAALAILGHRIIWSTVLLVIFLTALRRWAALLRSLRDFKLVLALVTTALLLAVNWLTYIWGVTHDQVLYTSLGYFVNPLVSIVLGMLFLGERLRRVQWLAVLLAVGGLAYLMWSLGTLPWITLTLAVSFGFYGLLRKVAAVDSLLALAIETFVLTVPATCGLAFYARTAPLFGEGPPWHQSLLLFSGLATTAPLLFFGMAARRLPLSVLGFLQYLAPSVQFLLGILVFGEEFSPGLRVCYFCTWAALALLTAEALMRQPAIRPAEDPAVHEAPGERTGMTTA